MYWDPVNANSRYWQICLFACLSVYNYEILNVFASFSREKCKK